MEYNTSDNLDIINTDDLCEHDAVTEARATPESAEPADSEADIVAQTADPVKSKKQNSASNIFEYIETFCFALAAMVLLFMFVFRLVTVDGMSMSETLAHDDKLIISNMFYTPQTGDIVVINRSSDANPLIKRIIATGGQTVKIDFNGWQVWVDGVLLDETYVTLRSDAAMHTGIFTDKYTKDGICEFTVDEGCIFVMGDNRNNSLDSRYYGFFEYHEIVGRVVLRLSPRFGTVE